MNITKKVLGPSTDSQVLQVFDHRPQLFTSAGSLVLTITFDSAVTGDLERYDALVALLKELQSKS